MSTPLLATKLYFPSARLNLVSRPHLVERLIVGMRGSLTLISAPAGYGKTTLMGEWRAGAGSDVPAAWLSLDAADNNQGGFLAYLVATLQTLQPGLVDNTLQLLRNPHTLVLDAILTVLLNDLSSFRQDFILALDDYHVIQDSAIHAAITFLLDHLPPLMHLVILTRADPPLPLARLRARSQLVEIRAGDLRFTSAETVTFLNQVMGLNLPAQAVAALEARAEGWIAGLQLAALSMQGRDFQNLDAYIAEFTGSHRYIADYLVEEVLNRQPDDMRHFLLQTSILKRLTGSLCSAVTGQPDGQELLVKLEKGNIFLTPLDDERCWYRYHHLFADMLHKRLKAVDPVLEVELHCRASRWYEQNHWMDYAIEHAIQADEWSRAILLMEQASQLAIQRGEFYKIKSWVEMLPGDCQLASPGLSIHYGWAILFSGDFDKADQILAEIEPALGNSPILKVSWLAAKVWAARGRGEQARAVELALEALKYPDIGDIISRCTLWMSLSLAYWHLGNMQGTLAAAEQGVQLAEQTEEWNTWVILMSRVALVKAAQGYLREAERLYLRSLQKRPNVPAWTGGGVAQFYLSALYYEWNDLDRALEYARLGVEYSQITGYLEFCVNSYRQQAYIYQAQGDPRKALEALEQAAETARAHNLPDILWGPLNASRVKIALAQGDIKRACAWIDQVQGGYGASVHYLKLPLESAKLALAQGDKPTAAALLAEPQRIAIQNGIGYAIIEILTLQAMAARNEDQALEYLCQALEMARPEGYVRTFVDQGKALIPLLQKVAQRGITPDYIAQLLAAFPAPRSRLDPQFTIGNQQPAILDPLSAREIEVLRLIAAGCSNKEIAAELFIAIGTVKRHTVNIFQKMDAANRTEAVALARELNLL